MARIENAFAAPTIAIEHSSWQEIDFIVLHLLKPGTFRVPPRAFHTVSTLVGAKTYARDEANHVRELDPDTVQVRSAGASTQYAWTEPHRVFMACLSQDLVERAAAETGAASPNSVRIRNDYGTDDPITLCMLNALRETANMAPHGLQTLAVESIGTALACRLLASYQHEPVALARKAGLDARSARRVRRYIEENVERDLSLDELARVAGMSRFHFSRAFKASEGTSPMAYVLRRKVDRAITLFAEGDRCVALVAAQLGFCDQSHFARVFKRFTSVSPAAWQLERRASFSASGAWTRKR